MKTTITKTEYDELQWILNQSRECLNKMDELDKRAVTITEEEGRIDWTFDEVWNQNPPNVDNLLKNLGLTVKD